MNSLKILIVVKHFLDKPRGAEMDLITLAKELAKNNEIFVISSGNHEEHFEFNGIKVHHKNIWIDTEKSLLHSLLGLWLWEKAITKEIINIRPNLIFTQVSFAPLAVFTAKKKKIPTIVFLKSYEHFCFKIFTNGKNCNKKCFGCTSTLKEKLMYLPTRAKIKLHEFALRTTTIIISNSAFVKDICKKLYGLESKVVYPFINLKDYISHSSVPKEYITFFTPRIEKGVEIFLQIAKSLPETKFLAVGEINSEEKKKLMQYTNIEYIPPSLDIKSIYAKTKILLVPSIWVEPFGRVCVEAMINGIPCIVSNRGGLPEAVGEAGILIDNPYNINSWASAIQKLNNDKSFYQTLSIKSKKYAQNFAFENTYNKFLQIWEEYFNTLPNKTKNA